MVGYVNGFFYKVLVTVLVIGVFFAGMVFSVFQLWK